MPTYCASMKYIVVPIYDASVKYIIVVPTYDASLKYNAVFPTYYASVKYVLCQAIMPVLSTYTLVCPPIMPEEEPLAGLLCLLCAALGQDLPHFQLHLSQAHLSRSEFGLLYYNSV